MEDFNVGHVRNTSVGYLSQLRSQIEMEPVYQRQGSIWSIEKQQLLIDSLINGFDVPKIYFHEFVTRRVIDGKRVKYAIVDGKQRLQAIWDFLDDLYPLADDFSYFEDPDVAAAGLTYSQLVDEYPDVVALLNSTSLDVIGIRTDDVEIIEEMFSRLNEAVPLNAAEKRNAFGGPLPAASRELADNDFFKSRLPFKNTRYRHWDLAAKFLYWEYMGGPADSKKFHLDTFFKSMKKDSGEVEKVVKAKAGATTVLGLLNDVFQEKDPLLEQLGMVSVYYLAYRHLSTQGQDLPVRDSLVSFNDARRANRVAAESELSNAQYELLEFDRHSQSPNDSLALSYRLKVLLRYLDGTLESSPPSLDVDGN
ncbi:DUF262 domain-containing protein [Saccharothrix sp. Mg75]|uniref:DUF262 domain-containing protein n=1 Tax=Saccharothrix sp. Mg75 TaxID=3445357 RepID=UPI003EEE2912